MMCLLPMLMMKPEPELVRCGRICQGCHRSKLVSTRDAWPWLSAAACTAYLCIVWHGLHYKYCSSTQISAQRLAGAARGCSCSMDCVPFSTDRIAFVPRIFPGTAGASSLWRLATCASASPFSSCDMGSSSILARVTGRQRPSDQQGLAESRARWSYCTAQRWLHCFKQALDKPNLLLPTLP